MLSKIRIGTRSSKLAVIQTCMVADRLRKTWPDLDVEIVYINTSGDWRPEQGEVRLSTLEGGKAQFAKEIEQAIQEGFVDCGVHSMKDMASFLPDNLTIDCFLPREDARDAFLSNDYSCLEEMPAGSVIGTSSLRRQAMILNARPDLQIETFRGNVPTRIEKLRSGQVDATILALAGLKRMELEDEISSIIPVHQMLPAACQGTVGIEHLTERNDLASLFKPLNCVETRLISFAERAVLQAIDGSCHTPVGAYATFDEDKENLSLTATLLAPDGSDLISFTETSNAVTDGRQAKAFGHDIGMKLKKDAPAAWIEAA